MAKKPKKLPLIVGGVVLLCAIGALSGGGEDEQTAAPPPAAIVEAVPSRTMPTEPVVAEPEETEAPAEKPAETPAASEAPSEPAPEPTPAPEPAPVSQPEPTPASSVSAEALDYVLNTNTMKFHNPHCSSVGKMSEKNRQDVHATRDDIIAQGYSPCGNCKP